MSAILASAWGFFLWMRWSIFFLGRVWTRWNAQNAEQISSGEPLTWKTSSRYFLSPFHQNLFSRTFFNFLTPRHLYQENLAWCWAEVRCTNLLSRLTILVEIQETSCSPSSSLTFKLSNILHNLSMGCESRLTIRKNGEGNIGDPEKRLKPIHSWHFSCNDEFR